MRNAVVPLILVALALMALPVSTAAQQQGTTLSGTITQGESGQPMAGALVVIDELRLETRTDADGRYTFQGVPPGSYHVGVRAEGYTTRRTEVTVAIAAREPRRGGRIRSALCRSAVGEPHGAAAVRVVSADLGADRAGVVQAAREHDRRDAAVGARHRHARLRRGAGPSRHPRARRRPRGGARRRPAHGRSLQPVRRSRRGGESGRREQDRGGARSRHAALRRQRDRRPRQRDHRSDPIRRAPPGHPATSRSIWAATAVRPAAPATFMSATVNGRFTSAAAGSAWATTRRRKARWRTRSRG